MTKIGFVGCGKLGLPVQIALDWKGHDVMGLDCNPAVKPGVHASDLLVTKEAGPDGTGDLQDLAKKKWSQICWIIPGTCAARGYNLRCNPNTTQSFI